MRSVRRALLVFVMAVAAATSLLDAPPALAAAPDQLQENALVTYQLVPAKHVIHVTVRNTMSNRKPSTSVTKTCLGWFFDPWYGWISYPTTCRYRTDYYYNSETVYIEADATHLQVHASSGSASFKRKSTSGNWRTFKLSFSPLFYGQTRTITYSYDLPAGGPRTYVKRRAAAAITTFCAYGPGTDTGEVRIILPAGYEITRTSALKQISSSGSTWTWSSGKLKSKPWMFESCINGSNPRGSAVTPTAAGAPITAVSAWKDDPKWAAAAAGAAADSAKLAEVLGPLPQDAAGAITLVETTSGNVSFDPFSSTRHQLSVSEAEVEQAAMDDDIAGIWFPDSVFRDGWLHDGYVRWAESAAGVAGPPCTQPGTPPSDTAKNLSIWQGRYMADTHEPMSDSAAYQLNAACWILTQVADAIGPDQMRATMDAMRTGASAWTIDGASAQRGTKQLNWQTWLDIVTAQGYLPAGKDPQAVADLLTQFGIATEKDHLADRAKALTGYAALQTTTGGKVPASILPAIAGWHFDEANTAIDTANTAWSKAAALPGALAGASADGGPVQQAVQAAKTQADLDAAVALADSQTALAGKVAAALALEAAPRDVVQQIGLLGTTLPSDAAAIDAVTKMDTATANASADQISATIDGAKDAGMQRIEIAVGVVLGVVLLVVAIVLLRRRRHRRPAAAVATAIAADAPGNASTAIDPSLDAAAPSSAVSSPGSAPVDEAPPPPPATE